MKIKVGFGFDVHQLQEGRKLVLGGVDIPHDKGALGHSDADVVIHALCDALLGAAGLKDIGFYFPDTDAAFKNIDSTILLSRVIELIEERKYTVGNADISLVLEKPKIKPHIDLMKEILAPILKISTEDISI
jgi:2-C-methyl-D-erythritol 2,4-cyclodiphosphate synthase